MVVVEDPSFAEDCSHRPKVVDAALLFEQFLVAARVAVVVVVVVVAFRAQFLLLLVVV